MEPETFGVRLFSRRVQFNMTQAELGEELGRTQTCISYWETGRREPSLTDLERLSITLKVTVDWLVTGRRNGILTGSKGAPRAAVNDRGAGKGAVTPMQHRPYTGTGS